MGDVLYWEAIDCWRNRIAQTLANLALRLAREDYRKAIGGAVTAGLRWGACQCPVGRNPRCPIHGYEDHTPVQCDGNGS
jgi:hypothetical protein